MTTTLRNRVASAKPRKHFPVTKSAQNQRLTSSFNSTYQASVTNPGHEAADRLKARSRYRWQDISKTQPGSQLRHRANAGPRRPRRSHIGAMCIRDGRQRTTTESESHLSSQGPKRTWIRREALKGGCVSLSCFCTCPLWPNRRNGSKPIH